MGRRPNLNQLVGAGAAAVVCLLSGQCHALVSYGSREHQALRPRAKAWSVRKSDVLSKRTATTDDDQFGEEKELEEEEPDGPEVFNLGGLASGSSTAGDYDEIEDDVLEKTATMPRWSGKDGDRTLIDLDHVPESFKSGFVSIVGHPNAGKSTLMNRLVGVPDLCITTNKAQTTRHRIMGVVTGDNFQIVYSDTPGILEPRYKLQEEMMQSVQNALSEADVLLAVVDVSSPNGGNPLSKSTAFPSFGNVDDSTVVPDAPKDKEDAETELDELDELEALIQQQQVQKQRNQEELLALTKVLADDRAGRDLLVNVLQAATQPIVIALNKVDLVDGSGTPKGASRRGGKRGRGAKNRNIRRQEAMAAKRAKRENGREADLMADKKLSGVATVEETEATVDVSSLQSPLPLDPEGKLTVAADAWKELLPHATIVPVSAAEGRGCDALLDALQTSLPFHPPLYPADTLTDKPEKFFASEIIREKILLLYGAEVPYSCEVEIKSFKDEPELLRIGAVVYVARDSQKGIVIGKQGRDIKRLGTKSRSALETFFDKKVFLDLRVQVSKDWRFKEEAMKRYGYGE